MSSASGVTRKQVGAKKLAFLGDIHIPFQDHSAVDVALDFLRWFRPDRVDVIGDLLDFYVLSSFDHDPRRKLSLQDELEQGRAFFRRLRAVAPNAEIRYLEGNHEHRLQRYLRHHPELFTLRSLHLPEMLGLADVGVSHHGYHEQLWHGDFLIEHGDAVRGRSAYTAAAMLEKRGVSGLSGHSHRLGIHHRTDNRGSRFWVENGCLAHCNPEYVIGVPDWQQGFSVGYLVDGEKLPRIEQIQIVDGQIYYAGVAWRDRSAVAAS